MIRSPKKAPTASRAKTKKKGTKPRKGKGAKSGQKKKAPSKVTVARAQAKRTSLGKVSGGKGAAKPASQRAPANASERPIVVLHLSDTHRTPDEPVSNDEILLALKADLDRHASEGIPRPDIVMVTGDLVQSAKVEEYDDVEALFSSLLKYLQLDRDRMVLVPGNHDVHWRSSEDSFRHRMSRPDGLHDDYVIPLPAGFLCTDPDDYQQRLDNFRAFYRRFYGKEYPRPREEQFAIHKFPDLNLAFACFSSCDLNDHSRNRARIHPSAINRASDALAGFDGLKVAAWHHDYHWDLDPGPGFLEPESLRYLSMGRFDLGLCGHTHRPLGSNTHQAHGLPLSVVAAGSLCAGPRARVESVPRSYNVIELRPQRTARIHVRHKERKDSVWRAAGSYPHPTTPLTFVSWFDIPLSSPQSSIYVGNAPPLSRVPGTVRTPHPFRQSNAKSATRGDVVDQFVWTNVADVVNSDIPQVVLGPRGSGKTALLLSLTFEGRVATADRRPSSDLILDRLGLMCPMRIGDVTAFSGKEAWQPTSELRAAFSAMLANLLANDLVSTLQSSSRWCSATGARGPTETEATALLWATWSKGCSGLSYDGLITWITQQRTALLQAVGIRDDGERHAAMAEIVKHPLMRSGVGPIADAVVQLAKWDAYSRTRWHLLFDEVEFLEAWQKACVYNFLVTAPPPLSAKIATLPYAHRFALEEADGSLLEGSDFDEVPLALTAQLEFRNEEEEETSTSFIDVCEGIWRARAEQSGFRFLSLKEAWPKHDLLDILDKLGTSAPATTEELADALLDDLPDLTRKRARELRMSDSGAFSDQYWRKYQQPFRFRLAERLAKSGTPIPLYWGWPTLLRACDGNCRWFLQLADKCWQKYWSRDGIRPLTPREQDEVLRDWARGVRRRLATSTTSGRALQDVVDRVVNDLSSRLYGTSALRAETLTVQVSDLTDAQAEAVGFGVAHGFLVPKFVEGHDAHALSYPMQEVELRLGFPIAVDSRLPLRAGAVLKIPTLRQVVMPWLKDQSV